MPTAQVEPQPQTKPKPASGDTADNAHLRKAKRAYNRTIERAAKRQYEQELA